MSEPTPVEGPSGFGYPMFRTIAMCVPWSDRHLPPELPIAFRNCAPPMNTNAVYLETHKKPIADARNHFVEKALEFNAKYIFFWDEDVLVPPHALRELIYVADNWPKVGIVSGIYCLKVPRPEPLVFMKMGAGPYWDWKVGEVFEVQGGTGMGCTLLRTEMFKEISKPWFRTVDDNSAYMDNIPRAEAWTEDLWLCNKVKTETKWKIIVHGGLCMPHYDLATKLYYELPPDSKPMRHILLPQGQKKILDVGCGTNHYKTNEGRVVTFDIRDDVGADYRGDCRKLPFATESMDIVHSSHLLEHLARCESIVALREWARVLKPDGELRMLLPNLEWACKQIAAGEYGIMKTTNVCPMDVIYAQQQYPEDFHQTGFTPKLITDLLKQAGFKTIKLDTPLYHIRITASRLEEKNAKPKPNGKKKVPQVRRRAA